MRSGVDAWERECRVFARYLMGSAPLDYVVSRYVEAHRTLPELSRGDTFDQWILRASSSSMILTRLGDAFSRAFRPRSLVRKKLVLVLAILETSSPSYRLIDSVPAGGRLVVWCNLAGVGLTAVVSLILGTVVFAPLYLVSRGIGGPSA